jgi:hypothetical protein
MVNAGVSSTASAETAAMRELYLAAGGAPILVHSLVLFS